MRRFQLLWRACLIAALTATGCNRPAIKADAEETARDVKVAAARAGDQLADAWLTTKIQAQFFADADIKARYITVSTRDGVVTLKGRVENENAHRQAVQTAVNTDGVKQVQDQLVVSQVAQGAGPAEQMESTWITTKIEAKYFADPQVRGQDINVNTTNGVVTLTGRVSSDADKQHAASIARNTEGVARVDDRLAVQPPASSSAVATTGAATTTSATPPVDDARITATIESKYFGDELIKSRRVDVETHQGVVTLRGEVASESERAQALRLARTTDGVQRVEDSLTVNASLGNANAPPPAAPAPADRRAGIGQQIDDAAAVTKIQSKFFLDSQVRAGAINVTSKNGVVTLDGTAPSAAAKQRAIMIARETDGVAQVIDRITVARKPTAKR